MGSLEDVDIHRFMKIGRRLNRMEHAHGDLGFILDRVEQLATQSPRRCSCSSEQRNKQPDNLGVRTDRVDECVTEVEEKLDVGLRDLA